MLELSATVADVGIEPIRSEQSVRIAADRQAPAAAQGCKLRNEIEVHHLESD